MAACETSATGVAKANNTLPAATLMVAAVVAKDELDALWFLLSFLGIWARGRHRIIK
jgi:hypothetical protein